MNVLDYLDARADRRDARQLLLIERGLDARSMIKGTLASIDPRFLIASFVIGLFASAFFREADKDTRNLMVGALIAAFAGAWGYYLGSSNTASRANDRADAAIETTREAVQKLPAPKEPDVTLKPGETAQAVDDSGQARPL